ncbi:protease modulator HflC [Tabrizicola sp.]|uniref:protease modulator HflC n=1 Tax=Tabrizicola sp. TaxID=2005166 RepID=UPI002735DE2B|nr:protease modulator HflC [Tabrizicola sp.]MDP3194864.1 protease modulator HflC [Tabrizicola sp.]
MMRAIYIIPAFVVLLVLILSSVFIVDERKRALVLQFGQVMQVKEDPGLGFKIPLVQDVVLYEDRILGLQTQPIEVTLLSDRRLVVDAFARWRIVNLIEFRQSVGTAGEDRAQQLLGNILSQAIPEVLGNATQEQVLSQDRAGLMNQILTIAKREGSALGIDVIDVRLTRTDLPEQNLEATFARMRSERDREAADERARGGEAAQRVRASADRTVIELTSDARRQAEVIRGEADAERNRILAEAYGQDPEFFAFTRSLTAYEVSLQGGNSSIVMQPDSEFFDYLRSDAGRPSGASVGPTTAAPAADASAPAVAPSDVVPAEPAAEEAPANP